MPAMATEIIEIVTGSMTAYGTGSGTAIVDMFNAIFVAGTGDTATITNFGIYSLVFLGIAVMTGIIGSIVAKVG